MKKLAFILMAMVCSGFTILAQSPGLFNYQAVVRNSSGDLITNSDINFRLSIREGSSQGTAVFSETQLVESGSNGVCNLKIGDGNNITGNLSTIDWSSGTYFLQIETDVSGGESFTETGTVQLLSVPYAMYANAVSNTDDADADSTNEIQDLNLDNNILTITGNPDATSISLAAYQGANTDNQELNLTGTDLSITGGNSIDVSSLVNDADADPTNELQNLTFSGDTLGLENGNHIIFPYDSSHWAINGQNIYYNTGNVGIGSSSPGSKLEVKADASFTVDDTLFSVKDKDGNIVFAVFPDGAKVYVNEGVKGRVGGFAVTGRNPTKAPLTEEEYLRVTPDSTRIWVTEDPTKARVGGFAVTGRNPTKGMSGDYLVVTSDSTRIYINDTTTAKRRVGGFAVTGRNPTKGPNDDYLRVTRDSTRVYVTESETKGRVGGFAVTGRNPTKGDITSDYFNISGNENVETVNSDARIFWYPKKEAFLTGRVLVESPDSVGTNSMATGFESKAIGDYSQAMGYKAVARGDYSTAIGDSSIANGISSFAFGDEVITRGSNSFAFGYNNQSIGQFSVATGNSSITYGTSSVAMGYSNNSGGTGSATFGYDNSAAGDYAMAAGRLSSAVGANSVAIGYHNYSAQTGSTSFGYDNNATGLYSLAAGRISTASGSNSVAIGYSNYSSKTGSASFGYDNDATGDYSLAAGYSNVSSGLGSSVFGYDNTASGDYSVAIGRQTSVAGDYSLAIGYLSSSSANYSYTIGESNQALQQYSFAFGKGCIANENFAFAFGVTASSTGEGAYAFGAGASSVGAKSYAFGEGTYTGGYGSYALGSNAKSYGTEAYAIGTSAIANANYSTAIGYHVNTASSGWDYATVLGKYNTSATSPLLVVGNGTSSTPSNALVMQTDGDLGLGVNNPGQKLDVNGNIRLTGGDRWLEINSGFLDIRPHDDTYGLILRDHTGYTSIWSSFRTVPSTTDYLHISMNSTSTTEGIIVSDNGSVGVGVLPGYKLDVNGEITSRSQNAFRLRNTTYSSILRNDNTAFYLLLTSSGNPDGGWNSLRPLTVGLSTGDVSIANTLHAKNSGYVGVGTSTPQNSLHVQGSRSEEYIAQFRNTSYTEPHGIKVVVGDYGNYVAFVGCKTGTEHLGGLYANTSGEIYLSGTSDRRVKNSITDTEIDATKIISELKVRDFYFNERPAEIKTTGFIAQEVMEVLPEMVIYDKDQDLYMVSKDFLVPYLTKAVQEQQYEIDLIKKNNENLQKENEELKQKLNEILELLNKE